MWKKNKKIEFERENNNIKEYRKKDYLNRVITNSSYAKEFRTTNIINALIEDFYKASDNLISNYKLFGFRISVFRFLLDLCNQFIPFFASAVYALYKITISNTMDIGVYTILSVAVVSLAGNLKQLTECYLCIYSGGMYIENLKVFLSYIPKISESQRGISVKKFEELSCEDVSFSYENNGAMVLENVSFKIKKNQKIAIVGRNGVGKTTMLKLLLRLYDPTKGRILLNGIDIKEYTVKEYRRLFGVVAQDSQLFSLTMRENILSGNKGDAIEAAKAAGIYDKICTFEKEMDTLLYKDFDVNGEILSGGEMQKLAIARMYAQNAEIAILDEPSSALDPIAENELFERLLNVSKNKTVIFISHRMSSTTFADVIYLIDEHGIAESGSHEQLMLQKGLYYDMYQKQALGYIDRGD